MRSSRISRFFAIFAKNTAHNERHLKKMLIFANEMNKKNLDIGYFLSFCIEQYKEAKHLSGGEVARIFGQYGVLEYLEEHFEPLHSQSRQWILEDIDEFISLRKGEVA